MRDDLRVQTFVERGLGPLLAEPDTSLVGVLAWIERLLGTDLGSAESRTSLHVALLALETAGLAPAR